MSENIDLLEEEIKEKMASYEVNPPTEVWADIAKQRSFGHITCNRIMQSYKMWGILLILSLIGGYLFFISAELPAKYNRQEIDENIVEEFIDPTSLPNYEEYDYVRPSYQIKNKSQRSAKREELGEVEKVSEFTPPQDVTAGLHVFSFGINPKLFEGQTIFHLIKKAKGHSIVEPFEVTNYEHMHKMQRRGLNAGKNRILNRKEPSDFIKNNTWKKRADKFSVLFSFTPEFITKSFQVKYFLSTEYAEKRKAFVRSRSAYTYSARGDYKVGKNGFLESGFDFTRISELSTIGNQSFNSNFSFISIPFLYGREINFQRIGWEIKGGFAYQLYNTYKGNILGADGIEVLNLNESAENPYKTSGIINLHIATGMSYIYSEKMKFIVAPYYKRTLNSITKSTAAFSEDIQYMGLSFGVKYDF